MEGCLYAELSESGCFGLAGALRGSGFGNMVCIQLYSWRLFRKFHDCLCVAGAAWYFDHLAAEFMSEMRT